MDRQPTEGTTFQSGVHDASIEGLLSLMIDDFEGQCQSYALYSETLAHALAMRFLLYKSPPEATRNYLAPTNKVLIDRVKGDVQPKRKLLLRLFLWTWSRLRDQGWIPTFHRHRPSFRFRALRAKGI
jgi:hypothetical protein